MLRQPSGSPAFEDDGAATCQGCHHLAQCLAEGEVPGGEGDADTDRLARHQLLQVPVGMIGSEADFADLLGKASSEVGEAAQDLATSSGERFFQLSKARCAELTARSRSALVARGRWPMIWPVAGSRTSSHSSVS